jgi:hypothetical protein
VPPQMRQGLLACGWADDEPLPNHSGAPQ